MRFVFLALIALTVLPACDDEAAGGSKVVMFGRDMAPAPQPDMGMVPDAAPPVMRRNKLVVQGVPEVSMFRGDRAMLSVRYLNADNQPIANGQVTLSPESPQQALVAIRARTVPTDANGTATFEVTAQQMDGRTRLKAEADNADAAFWVIRVNQNPVGEIGVRVTYDSVNGRYQAADIEQIAVQLIEGTCESAFTIVPGRRTIDGPAIRPFDGDDLSVIGGVPNGRTFAAVARGRNALNRDIVTGCSEGHTADGGNRVDALVELVDQPLEFKGIFNVEHRINLIGMLEGGENEDVNQFLDILEIFAALGGANQDGPFPRGNAMIQLLCDRAQIDQVICLAIRAVGAPVIEDWINDQAMANPDVAEALEVLNLLGDIFTNLSDLTIEGEMEFIASYPDEEGYLRDNQSRWQRMRFQWRQNCPFAQPEQCERIFNLADENMGRDTPIQANFDARLTEGETLLIGRHQLGLNYGLFILLALEEWILPLVTNEPAPVELDELFRQLIDCAALDNQLGLPMGTCDATIIPALSGLLRSQLVTINDGTDLLTMEGQVTVADEYPNLKVDRLFDGVWNGYFGDADERPNPEDLISEVGTFEGCRDTECALLPGAMEDAMGMGMNP
ncbi:MAG: Ig-like domain-containing protein [Myxococcota bacterium]|nr:Ig-like domain-containing protein [Myxococcota bacterium]